MKCLKLILWLCILMVPVSLFAQTHWQYHFYVDIDYSNFRQKSIFKQEIGYSDFDAALLNAAIFFATNEQRVKHGKSPVPYCSALEICAYNHSLKMAKTGFFSHENTKDESRRTTSHRGKLAGIKNPSLAENIAYTSYRSSQSYLNLADDIMDIWMNSSGHKSNILSDNDLQMGCGAYLKSSTCYATQCFQWFRKVELTTAQDELPGGVNYVNCSGKITHHTKNNNNEKKSKNNTPKVNTGKKALPANYFIVCASFSSKNKAEKYVGQLNRKGYSKAKVISSVSGYRVSLNGYPTKKEARKDLKRYRKSFKGAWIMKK